MCFDNIWATLGGGQWERSVAFEAIIMPLAGWLAWDLGLGIWELGLGTWDLVAFGVITSSVIL